MVRAMKSIFRTIGIAEGLSFLTLLGIAMPLKYVWGEPLAVRIVGWIHGMLFIAYVYLANRLAHEESWPPKRFWAACLAAILPFGTFVFDRRFLREQSLGS